MDKDISNAFLYDSFAYDDAFRTIESECDDVLIGLVNYFFGEHYDGTAITTRMRNEHMIEHEDGSSDRRITDSHFMITCNGVQKRYHLECESGKYDGTILVRMFEYNSQIALDEADRSKNSLVVRFPYTGLLLLRDSDKAPDKAEIKIRTPEGDVTYHIPIIKESDFTIDSIFENELYFLIPFYIFNMENQLDNIEENEEQTIKLLNMYDDIFERLDEVTKRGKLSAYSKGVIIRTSQRVLYKLAGNHRNIQKKVGDMMGGKVMMDIDIVKARHEGLAQGISQGISQGEEKGISTSVEKLARHYMKEQTGLEYENAVVMAEKILR